jgi:hypothetical protein
MAKSRKDQVIANLYGPGQLTAILEAMISSAFSIELQNSDSPTAILKLAGNMLFAFDLQERKLYRFKDNNKELVFTFRRKKGWFSTDHDEAMWDRFQSIIQAQGDIGGAEAMSLNVFRREEIDVLILAIRGMVFRIGSAPDNLDVDSICFNDEEVFRFNHKTSVLSMVAPNTKALEVVYTFAPEPKEWFWAGTDRDLLKSFHQALAFYQQTIQRVKMTTYRQMFGRTMQEIILKLADIMEKVEAEHKMLERIDSTKGGSYLHPRVADLIQKDLDEGLKNANE